MKTLLQQASEYKPPAALRKSFNLEKMKPAFSALDGIAQALQAQSIYFDFSVHVPYLERGETVIKPISGSRRDFVHVLKQNGFKRAVSTACYESYTKGKAIVRLYWWSQP